jgi:hypothetical protein
MNAAGVSADPLEPCLYVRPLIGDVLVTASATYSAGLVQLAAVQAKEFIG